jgi:AmmeMemoRadiSam system protein B
MIRRPAVAGRFYDASPEGLKREVSGLIVEGGEKEKEKVVGIISPHAGFIYSGPVAGAVYSRIQMPMTFIIIGPNHTGYGERASVMTSGEWEMPNGNVPINSELAKDILARSRFMKEDENAHLREHSIEVQIPFIQYFTDDFDIVPIALMSIDYKICEDIGKAISEAVKESKDSVVIVASTDMTHYEPQTTAEDKDKMAIEHLLKLDPMGLYNIVRDKKITMCGLCPTVAMLIASKELGAKEGLLVRYMTSGEVSGDYDQVVGYAGVLIK